MSETAKTVGQHIAELRSRLESERDVALAALKNLLAATTGNPGARETMDAVLAAKKVLGESEESAVGTEPIHDWFELTYSNYLVLPRAVLQSMPVVWQRQMVRLLQEGDAAFGHLEWPRGYRVSAIGERGRFIEDPIPHYNRGRTRLEPRKR